MPKILKKASDEHEFYSLEQRSFEHFAAALHEAQPGILTANVYAPDGQQQFGIDHVAFRKNAAGASVLEVGQSKAYRQFRPSDLTKATNKFLENWETRWKPMNVTKLIVFVGCTVKSRKTHDALIIETAKFAKLGIDLELWDAWRIYNRLSDAPQVVWTHLGREVHAKLFGDGSAPFADLQRELLRGDMTGRRAIDLIARLNQAETAEIEELKRRVRRGEGPKVFEQLEVALHQPAVADAMAPDVRAGMERLAAGLAIAKRDFPYAKLLLDRANARDGDPALRLRAMLVLESEGPDAALAATEGATDDGVREVRAVAELRRFRPALALEALTPALTTAEPPLDTLRLAGLAYLALRDRENGILMARKSVARDPDARACQQALAVALFNAALAPSVPPELGEWPQPVDLAFVQSGNEAQARLAEAEAMFRKLAADPAMAGHESMVAWHVASMILLPGHRSVAQKAITVLEESDGLTPGILGWAMAHAFKFDASLAAASLDRRITADANDFEARIVRTALANFTGDPSVARTILTAGKDALVAAGYSDIVDYWLAVIALESHGTPKAETLRKHPWLDLRAAMAIRQRKPRLTALTKVAERQAGKKGDRRVLLAASQLLLEGGWHKSAAKYSRTLIEDIGTSEAIGIAAETLYRVDDNAGALSALDRLDAFADGRLPLSFERLRVACLAGSGRIPAAVQASAVLATQTHAPHDIWSTINMQIAMGAVPAALALWEANADLLSDPSPGHILLARAAIHVDPEKARRITAQIAPSVPDSMVTAAYELSSKLHMNEQRVLMSRIVQLGSDDSAGVLRIDSVEDALALIEQRREAVEKAKLQYRQGHAPAHMLAMWRPGSLAAGFLGSDLFTEARRAAGDVLGARYGRKYDGAIWPAERNDVQLVADVTALLTAQNLDLLDKIERAFQPISIGTDAINAVGAMRRDLEEMQPERLDAMRAVAAQLNDGALMKIEPTSQVDSFTVLWTIESGEPDSTLNFSKLISLLRPRLSQAAVAVMIDALGNTLEDVPKGITPPDGSVLNIDVGMAILLEQAGTLQHAAESFRLHIEPDQIAWLHAEIANAVERATLIINISLLYDRLAAGIADGTYQFVPPVKGQFEHPLKASLMQALSAVGDTGAILWIDDRFISSIDNPRIRIVTSSELLDALHGYQRINAHQLFALRQRLRSIDWLFLPIRSEEVVHHLRAALNGQILHETEDLKILRQGVATILRHRRLLQWPDVAAFERGIRGEVPFLLELGHMVAEALAAFWTDKDLSVDAARVASGWVLKHLDVDQYPLPMLAAGDPRSDYMQGLRIAHLILFGLQIIPVGAMKERQKLYLEWIWNHFASPRLEERPELFSSMAEMMEQHLIGADEDVGGGRAGAPDKKLWHELAGSFLNALPDLLRRKMLSRPAIMEAFDLTAHGVITIGTISADEMDFWKAMATLDVGKSSTLPLNGGSTVKLSLEKPGTTDQHVCVKLRKGGYRIDDWPWRIGRDDPVVRLAALEERADLIDGSVSALIELNNQLGGMTDRAQRIRRGAQAAAGSIAAWYAEFASNVASRHEFAPYQLIPDCAASVLEWMRFEAGTQPAVAAEKINADRGFLAVVDRIGSLPIDPDQGIVALFKTSPPTVRTELIHALGEFSPWHALFAVKLLLQASVLDKAGKARARAIAIAAATDPQRKKEWQLYVSLTRYLASHATNLPDWATLDAAQQLAFIWGHASKLAITFIAAELDPASIATFLDNSLAISPREIVEQREKYSYDAADPRIATDIRVRSYASLGALLALNGARKTGPVFEALSTTLFDGRPSSFPSTQLLQGTLAPSIFPNSYFSTDFGWALAEFFPQLRYAFGAGLTAMIHHALTEAPDSHPFRTIWTYLRQASGNAPLPAELEAKAHDRIGALRLTETPDGVEMALHVIISVTALAATNGWTELKASIDAAVDTLWLRSTKIDLRCELFFEIAMWRARMEDVSGDRCRIVAQALRRCVTVPERQAWAIEAARHFARTLSGQDTEPFVDILGDFRN